MRHGLRSILTILALQSQLFGLLGGGLVLCVGEDGHAVVEAIWLGQSPCCDSGDTTGLASSTDIPAMGPVECGPCEDYPLGAQIATHRQNTRTCSQLEPATAAVQHTLLPVLALPAADTGTMPIMACWYTPPPSHTAVLLI